MAALDKLSKAIEALKLYQSPASLNIDSGMR